MQAFTDAQSVNIAGQELCSETSKPLQQLLARAIDIAQLGEVDDE